MPCFNCIRNRVVERNDWRRYDLNVHANGIYLGVDAEKAKQCLILKQRLVCTIPLSIFEVNKQNTRHANKS